MLETKMTKTYIKSKINKTVAKVCKTVAEYYNSQNTTNNRYN